MTADPLNPTLHELLMLCRMDRTWVKGNGTWLWDAAGRRFCDFYAQYGAVVLGHNSPLLNDAAHAAMCASIPALVQPYGATYAVELARRLQELAPGNLSRCVLTTSGAQSVEAALKLVRAKTGRPLVLAARGSFHGKTLGALALSGQRQYADGFGPLPRGVLHVPFGDAPALERALDVHRERVAGFFVEPIQGERGVIVPPPGYLRRAEELCRAHGVALVVDEVQTGLGRTGPLFACETEGVTPDVLLLAKALGGGLFPLGACLVHERFWDERFALRHSSTFANNNIASQVGLAVLEALTTGGVQKAAVQRGMQLQARLERLASRYPRTIRETRCRGLLGAIELHPVRANRSYVLAFLHEHGVYSYAVTGVIAEKTSVLVLPTLGQRPVLRITPPLTITESELEDGFDALERFFCEFDKDPAACLLRTLAVSSDPEHSPRPRVQRRRMSATEDVQQPDVEREDYIPSVPLVYLPPRHRSRRRCTDDFAFLVHYTRPEDVTLTNPGLREFTAEETGAVCRLIARMPPGVVMRTPRIESTTGASVRGSLITVPLLPEQMQARGLRRVAEEIQQAVDVARSLGAKVVGLGAYTSPYSGRGRLVTGRGPHITTGSALTAGMAVEALACAAERVGLDRSRASIAVVGAGGSVGKLGARLLARWKPRELHLIGNPARGCQSLTRLQSELEWRQGHVRTASSLDVLADCDLVLTASGAIEPILDAAPFKAGAIVCDVARPADTSETLRQRTDIDVIEGGLVALPDPTLRFGVGNLLGLPDGVQLACFAETMLLALEGTTRDHGIGDDVPIAEVDAMMALAERHGFRLAPLPEKKKPALARSPVAIPS